MMKKHKTITAISCAAIVIAATVGSLFFFEKNESYILQVDQTHISPEVYNAYLVQKTLLALENGIDTERPVKEQDIEGMPVTEWIETRALDQIIYDYVIKSEWDKLEEDVSESELERLDTYLERRWEFGKEIFVNNESDKDIFDEIHQSFLYNTLVFDNYSEKNPVEEEAELQQVTGIASVKYFQINKFNMDGRKYTEEDTKKLIAMVEDYVKELKDGKSIDEIYKNYLINTGQDSSAYRPISTSVISNDNDAYTSKIPEFVNALMEAEIGEPFFVEDENYVTVGIRQNDKNQKNVQEAYTSNAVKKMQQEKFDEYINGKIKNVKVKTNDKVINKHSPESIKLPKGAY